jgi:hypothetical protein
MVYLNAAGSLIDPTPGNVGWKLLKRVPDAVNFASNVGKVACFVAGTQIAMADGTTKAIEDIEIGDEVLTRDQFADESGPITTNVVVRTFERKSTSTLSLHLDNGKSVETTAEHPFFVDGLGFVRAAELRPADNLVEDDNESTQIVAISQSLRTQIVYNFEVANTSTYFIVAGRDNLWVHNRCAQPGVYIGTARDGRFYVGQSQDVPKRIGPRHHKLDPDEPVQFFPMPGSSKRDRLKVEQEIINSLGGARKGGPLANERNPIDPRKWKDLGIAE